jgi:hypothetical protein
MAIHDMVGFFKVQQAGLDPDVQTAGAKTGAEIDARNFPGGKAVWTVLAGTLGTNATVDFKVQDCDTSGGTFADITGAAITQLTQAGTDESDTAVDLEHEIKPGRPFLKGILTIGTATSDAGATCHLCGPSVS